MNQIKNQAVCYLCSILDERTKAQRRIVYDSPAATKKVFDVCHALQLGFKHVFVITMARGEQQGDRQVFPAFVKKTAGLPVLYAQFNPFPMLTYLVSALSLMCLVGRIVWKEQGKGLHLIVYNRNWLYVPSLALARLLNAKCYLDLEDGALVETSGFLARVSYWLIKSIFDALCSHGSVLVTPSLIAQVSTQNNVVCYGVARGSLDGEALDWRERRLRFLLGGSLMRETGAQLLMEAVRILIRDFPSYEGAITILVTGHGPMADEIAKFAQLEGKGWVEFHGRVTKGEYDRLLGISHVGLCLKLPSCEMGTTTFPSKVIEIAAEGKLVLTTRLGHVSDLLGAEGAVYLKDENPFMLAKAMVSVVDDREAARRAALIGQQRVLEICSPEKVADDFGRLFAGTATL